MSNRFQDNNYYSIEGSKKLFVEYSHSIEFDFGNGDYPTGLEEDWDWEDVYIPVPHYYNGTLVAGHTYKRERLDKSGNWSLPMLITGKPFSIDGSGSLEDRPDASGLADGTTYYDEDTGILYTVSGGEWDDGIQLKGDSGDLLEIGTVITLAAGSSATASLTGESPNKKLNLGIPKGLDGAEIARETMASLVGQTNFFYQVVDAENIAEVHTVNFDELLVKNAGTGATIYTYTLTPPDSTDGAGNTYKSLTGLSDNLAAGTYDMQVTYTSGKSLGTLIIRSNKV